MRLVRYAAFALALLPLGLGPSAVRAAPAPQEEGYLGVQVTDVDSAAAASLRLPGVRGARVEAVADSSPAQQAGLQKDDVITAFAGQPVESVAALTRLVRETPPGREVSLTYYRGGSSRSARVRTGERPGMSGMVWVGGPGRDVRVRLREVMDDSTRRRIRAAVDSARTKMDSARREMERSFRVQRFRSPGRGQGFVFSFMGPGRLGVRLQSLGDQLGAYFGAADGHGALIAEVEKGTAAEKAGLKAGDVIVGVAGKDVEDPGDVVDAIHEADEGPVKITILRDRKRMTVTADLPARRGSGDEADFSVMAPGVAPGELLPPHAPYVHVGPGASWIGAPPAGVVAPAPPEMRWIRAPVAPGAVPALPALPAVPPRWTRFVNRYI